MQNGTRSVSEANSSIPSNSAFFAQATINPSPTQTPFHTHQCFTANVATLASTNGRYVAHVELRLVKVMV